MRRLGRRSLEPMILIPVLLALAGPPNVVLVTIDTVRADFLHAYGHTIETPTTDRLAREGVLVEDATVQAPQTRPSHTSILTGRYPWEHGVHDNFSPPLADTVPTLATVLKARGYRTGAFIGSYVLSSTAGLKRGFDVYDEPFSDTSRGSRAFSSPERPAEDVVDKALFWLKAAGPGPFFAWLHLYDPHAPYNPPSPYDRKYEDQPYEGEIAYADAQAGRVLEFLDKAGLRGRTLFVVTSDHGEGLGDHGEDEHTFFLYDATLHVPLILSQPGVLPAGKRVAGQFRSVDLMPTVLALVGAPPVATSGASRAAELRAGTKIPDNESPSETLFPALHFGYAPAHALRAEGWKFIDVPKPELYNVKEDAGEAHDMVDMRSGAAAAMRDHLRAFIKEESQSRPAVVNADAGMLEKMAALGYVGGAVPLAGAASGADPKDKIKEYQQYRDDAGEAQRAYGAGQLDHALAIVDRLAKRDIVAFDVHKLRGTILARLGRYKEAIASFEVALRLVPKFDQLYVEVAQAQMELGNKEEARKSIERGLGIEPGNGLLLTAKGELLHRQGDLEGARDVLEKVRTRDPGNVEARIKLASVYASLGKPDLERVELKAATKGDPKSVEAWSTYGEALAKAGSKEEAMAAFRAALKLDARAGPALLGLARLQTADNPDAALALLQRLVSLDPGFPGVGEALQEARAAKAAAAARER